MAPPLDRSVPTDLHTATQFLYTGSNPIQTGVAPGTYFDQTVDALYLNDIVTGLVKSVAFGVEIALIACLTGFRIRGGAEGVGVATTRSVVRALVLIIATDLLFTAAFYFS